MKKFPILLIIGIIFMFSIIWFNISISYTNKQTDNLKDKIKILTIKIDSLESTIIRYSTKCDTIIIIPQPLKIYQNVTVNSDTCYHDLINFKQ